MTPREPVWPAASQSLWKKNPKTKQKWDGEMLCMALSLHYWITVPSNDFIWFYCDSQLENELKAAVRVLHRGTGVWIRPCSHTSPPVCLCESSNDCWRMGECVCVRVLWDADRAQASLQSDPFGRESRTNQIIVLVWHWVDPSVGQWADYPGWEWEWLNSELHPNEYIMFPLSLSTPLWNKEMRSTSALMRWWNSTSLFHCRARLIATQITFSN